MNSRNKTAKCSPTSIASTASFSDTCEQSEQDYRREKAARRDAIFAQVGASINCLAGHTEVAIDGLAVQVHQAMAANGFWDFGGDDFGTKVALIHTEVSELLEANRNNIEADDKIPDFTGEEAEAADIIIRLLDLSGRRKWRLGEAITAKMLYNLSRPYKHGKAY